MQWCLWHSPWWSDGTPLVLDPSTGTSHRPSSGSPGGCRIHPATTYEETGNRLSYYQDHDRKVSMCMHLATTELTWQKWKGGGGRRAWPARTGLCQCTGRRTCVSHTNPGSGAYPWPNQRSDEYQSTVNNSSATIRFLIVTLKDDLI